jgi:arginase
MIKPITIIEAPLSVGVGLSGVERLPAALVKAGIGEAIGAQHLIQAAEPLAVTEIDQLVGIPEPEKVHGFLLKLANQVEAAITSGAFPLVLGGDCTVLLGCCAGAKRQGTRGLLYVDGHTDFYLAGAPDNETASMALAVATGRGPAKLTNLEGPAPLVEADRVVAFGFRDEAVMKRVAGTPPSTAGVLCIPLVDIRMLSFGNCVAKSLERLESLKAPFWIHFDVDVLDDAMMPAVDYRTPDGLSVGEVVEVLRRALATGHVAGMDVTILNPTLDWDGSGTRLLVDLLKTAFTSDSMK